MKEHPITEGFLSQLPHSSEAPTRVAYSKMPAYFGESGDLRNGLPEFKLLTRDGIMVTYVKKDDMLEQVEKMHLH